jgi:hypothetical protein
MSKAVVKLETLEQGFHSLSPKKAAAHAEASFYCLSSQDHLTGVEIEIQGSFNTIYGLVWDYVMTEQIERTWREKNEATEEGACGIAFLLMIDLTEYDDISRAWHTSGFDYYLTFADAIEPFQNAAKLEVSGIRSARNNSEIKQRVKEKLNQTDTLDDSHLPTYIVVVEFSKPLCQVVKK